MNGFRAIIRNPKSESTRIFGILDPGSEIEIRESRPPHLSNTINLLLTSITENNIDGIDLDLIVPCPLMPTDALIEQSIRFMDSDPNIFLGLLFAQRYLEALDFEPKLSQGEITQTLGKYYRVGRGLFEDCSICTQPFTPHQGYRKLPCGHIFHKKCADRWFKSKGEISCPYCRDVTKLK